MFIISLAAAGFNRRLAEYKARNTEENTLVNYFDFLEIHPIGLTRADSPIDCIIMLVYTELQAEDLNATLEEIKKTVGPPRNYGPSAEQKALAKSIQEQKAVWAALYLFLRLSK